MSPDVNPAANPAATPPADRPERWHRSEPGDLLSPHEDHAWQSFLEMQVRFWRKLAHLLQHETGLSEPEFAILSALARSPGGRLRPFELSGVTQFEKSRLHHQLTRMVGRGLITRERCPDAARAAMITLTDAGRDAILAALPRRAAHIREWLIEPLDAGRLAALTEASDAILEKLRVDETVGPDPVATTTAEADTGGCATDIDDTGGCATEPDACAADPGGCPAD
ncbi:MarR family winged helix-turn-helix transcriptional regulator [Yinghuangia sp. ASG 101]|uniref:MarR family winged helix-turn-helix transcriptional regulator n=1 Tax=Yinghuangia sp. ASG 101 TaxID=2896848 RepID=UPI001E5E8300|nr:MarR family winged helix-turn-helix transcriptional regulator [Yinghuangia sp. ASG 101]UGQ13404.1 MarR family winged helix-turn-helix transcriptional regulator [Yinghuangia sp. ASG 101]